MLSQAFFDRCAPLSKESTPDVNLPELVLENTQRRGEHTSLPPMKNDAGTGEDVSAHMRPLAGVG